MKKTLVLAVSAMIIFSGCGSSNSSTAAEETAVEATVADTEENTVEATETQTEETTVAKAEETAPTEQPAEEKTEKYVEDEVVNAFIANYNAVSESPFEEITNGNIRTKFYAVSYGYYLELLHANDTDNMHIRITETNDTAEAGTLGMNNVFHDCIVAIDGTISDDEINEFFDNMASQEYNAEDSIGEIAVKYSPDKELSSGHSRGYIEISAPKK